MTVGLREVAHGLTASSIRNSLFYSSCSALLDLVLGVIIAWLLTRLAPAGVDPLGPDAPLAFVFSPLVETYFKVQGISPQRPLIIRFT